MRKKLVVCMVIGTAALMALPRLSPGQAQKPPASQFFDEADANKDGKLSQQEFETYMQAKAKARAQQMFQRADTDKDGFVTKEEFQKLRAQRRGMMMGHDE